MNAQMYIVFSCYVINPKVGHVEAVSQFAYFSKYTYVKCTVYTMYALEYTRSYRVVLSQITGNSD